jgi:hypothetical protein
MKKFYLIGLAIVCALLWGSVAIAAEQTIHIQFDGFADDAVITYDISTGLVYGNRPYYGDYLRGVAGGVYGSEGGGKPCLIYVADTYTLYIIRYDRTWSNYMGMPPVKVYDGTWSFVQAGGDQPADGPTTEP